MPSPDVAPPAAADRPFDQDPDRAWWAGGDDVPASPADDRRDTDPQDVSAFAGGGALAGADAAASDSAGRPWAPRAEHPDLPSDPGADTSDATATSAFSAATPAAATPAATASAAAAATASAPAAARQVLPPSARAGRRVREGTPAPISPARALAGAAVAVAGVALGIGAVFTLADDSDSSSAANATRDPGASAPAATQAGPAPASSAAAPTAPPVAVTPTLAAAPPAAPAPVPEPAPPVGAPAPAVAPVARPSLTVLNNSRVSGLADRMAATFAKDGWSVGTVGNFTGRITSTTVYYAPGQEEAARQLAKAYALPRVLPRFAGLPGTGLTVVLTRDAA